MKARKRLLRIAGLLLLITAVVVAVWQGRSLDAAVIVQRVGELGPLAWLAFMALYALATVLFLPSSVLTLAGGDRLSAAGSAIRTAERAGALNKQQRSNRLPHRPALTPG